jgi:hypothetical protein
MFLRLRAGTQILSRGDFRNRRGILAAVNAHGCPRKSIYVLNTSFIGDSQKT